eukprot:jgi/Ulvmu1/7896/UM004_0128.1
MLLLNKYRDKCNEMCCEPITAVIEGLEQDESKALRLNGNSRQLFEQRITPLQLAALCESLREDLDIDLLDLSYNDYTPTNRLYDPAASTFGDAGAECIASLLKVNTGLRFLLLEGNSIGAKGASAIAESLGVTTGSNLQLLNLASNPIGDPGAAAFAHLVRTNRTLKMLDVGNCHIGLHGLLSLSDALSCSPSPALESLVLEGCLVASPPQDHAAISMAKMMSTNTSLRQIYLSKMGLRDCDLEVLVEYGLSKNQTLEVLDLRANKLSGMAAMHVARLLQENTSIRVLHLASNRISDEGILAIVESLPHNSALKELDVQSCGISDAGLDVLAKAILRSKTLRKVFVWGNEFGPTACVAWRDLALQASSQIPGADIVMDVEPVEVDGVPSIVFVNE